LKRIVCNGTFGGERVVNVSEHAHYFGAGANGPKGEWFHVGQLNGYPIISKQLWVAFCAFCD
jgi:hypothetical protein